MNLFFKYTFSRASSTAAECSWVRGAATLLISCCSTWFSKAASRGWCNWSSNNHSASLATSATRVTLATPNRGCTLAPPVALRSSTWKRLGVCGDEARLGVRRTSRDVLCLPRLKVNQPCWSGKSTPALAGWIVVRPTSSSPGSSWRRRDMQVYLSSINLQSRYLSLDKIPSNVNRKLSAGWKCVINHSLV